MRRLLVGLIKGRVTRQENPKLICFCLWTAMPVLSLLLILSCVPKERCWCCTLERLMVALSLAPFKGGDGRCGWRHAAAEPDLLFSAWPLMLIRSWEPSQLFGCDALSSGWKLYQNFTTELAGWATSQPLAGGFCTAFMGSAQVVLC